LSDERVDVVVQLLAGTNAPLAREPAEAHELRHAVADQLLAEAPLPKPRKGGRASPTGSRYVAILDGSPGLKRRSRLLREQNGSGNRMVRINQLLAERASTS
jgi:hypothetical protein